MALNEDNSGILSAFRGMGFTKTLSRKRGTKGVPESSESLTEKILAKLNLKNDSIQDDISSNWTDIVGANFANKCAPANLRLGILYVSTVNSAVKQEILFNERKILLKIHTLKGGKKIKKIRFL